MNKLIKYLFNKVVSHKSLWRASFDWASSRNFSK